MQKLISSILIFITISVIALSSSGAQDISLLPKYGYLPKNAIQQEADKKFISTIDERYKGDRKKAAAEVSMRGWQLLRQSNFDDAMRRFNQAWLLDSTNGNALWGMAALQTNKRGKATDALKLFAEAERYSLNDIDFSTDYAKAIGVAGAATKNKALLNDAFARFAVIYNKAPQHVLNLQNWAITLYYVGNYSESWRKIIIAEKAPRRGDLDPKFIAALQIKMPRP
jgi:tetratricopeptide (TPR) repeat protein